jgi:hypothetical protein
MSSIELANTFVSRVHNTPISLSSFGLQSLHNLSVLIHLLQIPQVSAQMVELILWEDHGFLVDILDSLPAHLPNLERLSLEQLPLSKDDPEYGTAADDECDWTPFTDTVLRPSMPNLRALSLIRTIPIFALGPSCESPLASLTSLELELPNLQEASHPARQMLSFLCLVPNLVHLNLNAFNPDESYMQPEELEHEVNLPPAPYVAMPFLLDAELTGNVIMMTQIVSRMCVSPTARVEIDTTYDCPIAELQEVLEILEGCPILGGGSNISPPGQEVHVHTLTLTSKPHLPSQDRRVTLSFARSLSSSTNNLSITVPHARDEPDMFVELIKACRVLSLSNLKAIMVGTVDSRERDDARATCEQLVADKWKTVMDIVDIS